jgi:hypothetical protein
LLNLKFGLGLDGKQLLPLLILPRIFWLLVAVEAVIRLLEAVEQVDYWLTQLH